MGARISFKKRIHHKYFFFSFFSVAFAKNILVLSNPDYIINFKIRKFGVCISTSEKAE